MVLKKKKKSKKKTVKRWGKKGDKPRSLFPAGGGGKKTPKREKDGKAGFEGLKEGLSLKGGELP